MSGRLIAVVGPSGVGKDSVMQGLAQSGAFVCQRRVITRAPDAGGEDYDAVDLPVFEQMEARGDFALSWRAHGLAYGVPVSVEERVAAGQDVLVNLSRGVLVQAQARFERFHVLLLSAPVDVLAARLASRGRETQEEVARRLARASFALPEEVSVVEVSNDGPLAQTVESIRAAFQAERA